MTKSINLALQGGGAHGAFTWGVLNRLLNEDVEIEAISATSAGAMNAAAFKRGWVEGGKDGARARMASFWKTIGDSSTTTPSMIDNWIALAGPFAGIVRETLDKNPFAPTMSDLIQSWSPYLSNPMNINPLRKIVEELYDDQKMHGSIGPKLFINATNVRTGKVKVFTGKELNADAILASACLPTFFQAIEIPDLKTGKLEAYWDGGFSGNPALFPLIYNADALDILIVHINPLHREELPKTRAEIENRINEVSFNSSLLRELRNIEFVERLIKAGKVQDNEMKALRIHSLSDDKTMTELGVDSKNFTDNVMLEKLHDRGFEAMDRFVHAHWNDIGSRSSCDLRAMFE